MGKNNLNIINYMTVYYSTIKIINITLILEHEKYACHMLSKKINFALITTYPRTKQGTKYIKMWLEKRINIMLLLQNPQEK